MRATARCTILGVLEPGLLAAVFAVDGRRAARCNILLNKFGAVDCSKIQTLPLNVDQVKDQQSYSQ